MNNAVIMLNDNSKCDILTNYECSYELLKLIYKLYGCLSCHLNNEFSYIKGEKIVTVFTNSIYINNGESRYKSVERNF